MINEVRNEPASIKNIPVQVAGDPEKRTAEQREIGGIQVNMTLFKIFLDIGKEYNIETGFNALKEKGERK